MATGDQFRGRHHLLGRLSSPAVMLACLLPILASADNGLARPVPGSPGEHAALGDGEASVMNVTVGISLIRFRGATPLTDEDLAAANTWPDLWRRMTNHGRAELIHRAARDLLCEPAAHMDLQQVESRPAFALAPGSSPPATNRCGLQLSADIRCIPVPGTDGLRMLHLAWSGSWSGSVQLLAGWESLAVRAFSAARTVPGIAYERVEEDEDGFVNTGGTTDLGGLFRRRKNSPKAKSGKPAASATRAATAGQAGEPDYSTVRTLETVNLAGQWLGYPGELLVSRHPLDGGRDSGELILVLTVSALP